MRFTYNGEDYSVVFEHGVGVWSGGVITPLLAASPEVPGKNIRDYTRVWVEKGSGPGRRAVIPGITVVRRPDEHPNREVARQWAVRKLLQDLGRRKEKELAGLVAHAFFTRSKKPSKRRLPRA